MAWPSHSPRGTCRTELAPDEILIINDRNITRPLFKTFPNTHHARRTSPPIHPSPSSYQRCRRAHHPPESAQASALLCYSAALLHCRHVAMLRRYGTPLHSIQTRRSRSPSLPMRSALHEGAAMDHCSSEDTGSVSVVQESFTGEDSAQPQRCV